MTERITPHRIIAIEERFADLYVIECSAPDPRIVWELRELLARAKSGDVRAIAIAYQCSNGGVGRTAIFEQGSAPHLYYALDWLKNHLLTYKED